MTLTDRPERIVSLAPSITECLFALGLDESVVGVTDFSNYPPKVRSLPKVGSYIRINLERVVALKPDLIVATRDGNPKETVERLTDMGFPVYVVDPRNLESLFRTILSLGDITQRSAQARTVVRDLEARLERLDERIRGLPRPKVFLQIGIDPLVTVGRGTLQDELIERAGGVNIAGNEPMPYPTLSVEHVLKAAPDVILLSTMEGETALKRALRYWEKWQSVPAVAENRIHAVDGDLIDRASPRIVDGLERMAGYIHP